MRVVQLVREVGVKFGVYMMEGWGSRTGSLGYWYHKVDDYGSTVGHKYLKGIIGTSGGSRIYR